MKEDSLTKQELLKSLTFMQKELQETTIPWKKYEVQVKIKWLLKKLDGLDRGLQANRDKNHPAYKKYFKKET